MAAAIEGLGPGLAQLREPECRALRAMVSSLGTAIEDNKPSAPDVAAAIQQALIGAAAALPGTGPSAAPQSCV